MKERTETLVYAAGGAIIGSAAGFIVPDILRWLFGDSTIPAVSEWLHNLARESKLTTTVIGAFAGLGLGVVVKQTIVAGRERGNLDENLRQAGILARQEQRVIDALANHSR